MFDGIADIFEYVEYSEKLFEFSEKKVNIIESRYVYHQRRLSDVRGIASNMGGCVSLREKSVLLREARISLFFEKTLSTKTWQYRAMLESIACGTPVIYSDTDVPNYLKDFVIRVGTIIEELKRKVIIS